MIHLSSYWALIPLTVLCSLHLVVGVMIGHAIWARQAGQTQPVLSPAMLDHRRYQATVDAIFSQARHLSDVSGGHSPPLSASLVDSIAKLLEAVGHLQRQVNDGKPGEKHPHLTGGQLRELTSPENPAADAADEELETARRPYSATQLMAPWRGRFPAPDEFGPVECHDLSTTGISFYTRDVPRTKSAVVTLGANQDLFVLVEIVNQRVLAKDGRQMYLVGCRFRKRFDMGTKEWRTDLKAASPLATSPPSLVSA